MPEKKIPKILMTPIARPNNYGPESIWNMFGESGKFSILDEQFKERERALFDYLGVPFVEINQPQVREALHRLALRDTPVMTGFKYKYMPKDKDWNGHRGFILFLRMVYEKLLLEKESRKKKSVYVKDIKTGWRACADSVAQKYDEYKKYKSGGEFVYSRYQEIKKNNPDVQGIKAWCESKKCTLKTMDELLFYIN